MGKRLRWASCTTLTPGAARSSSSAASGANARSNSSVSTRVWARSTGTRTQVRPTPSPGAASSRRSSWATLVSSPLQPVSGSIALSWLNRLKA